MAQNLLQGAGHCGPLQAARPAEALLRLFAAPDEQGEARWVAGRIQRLLGSTSHSLLDRSAIQADPADSALDGLLTPGDIAVLVRLKAQVPPLLKALEQAGIPCAAPAHEDFRQDPVCGRLLQLIAASCGFSNLCPELPGVENGDSGPDCTLPWTAATLPGPQGMSAWLQSQPWVGDCGELFSKGHAWRTFCRLWVECGSWPTFFEQ
ncbi:MAG: DNA helicase, partial [Desulfovibrionaceae bacterium]|nr:DNA helicase [Desulfovibrionaceae bacterium]